MTDINITISIPSDKMQDFKDGFKKVIIRQHGHEGLTDLQFFKVWIKDVIFNAYKTGKITIAKEATAPEIDLNIIDVD